MIAEVDAVEVQTDERISPLLFLNYKPTSVSRT